MVNMENAEEIMQILERFTRLKQKEIPKELDEYLQYVAKTGDTVFKWSSLKYLFREKLLNVIKHFHDTSPRVDEIPQYPNVDPFNYESMKSSLLERLELFNAAPFTIQRLCELLIDPRKQYSRIDKFMRALEKNILVVSTIEPGRKRTESENGDSLDSVVNGDLSLDVNVDIDMIENESIFNMETPNGNGTAAPEIDVAADSKDKPALPETSSLTHASDDDILPNPKKIKLDKRDKDKKKRLEGQMTTEGIKQTKETDVDEDKTETDSKTLAASTSGSNEKTEEDAKKRGATDDSKKQTAKKSLIEKSEPVKELAEEEDTNENKPEIARDNIEVEKQIEKNVNESSKTAKEETKVGAATEKYEETDYKDSAGEQKEEKIIEKQEIEKGEKEQAETKFKEKQIEKLVKVEIEAIEIEKKKQKNETTLLEWEVKEAAENDVTKRTVKDDVIIATVEQKTSIAEKAEVKVEIQLKEEVKKVQTAAYVDKNIDNVETKRSNETIEVNSTTKQPKKTEVATAGENKENNENHDTPALETPATEEIAAPIAQQLIDVEPPAADDAEVGQLVEDSNTTVARIAPILSLNDQPMDDVPLLEEAPPTVEEVIMAETTSTTEMSTDAIEPTKDEPAGMEVDDTSQEAMDQ